MIAKAVKGRGFRGALEYVLKKGRIIDSNMAGAGPRELAAEFGEIRKLRPSLRKAVLHVSLSAAPGEKLTDEQWREIGQRYLRGMGFTDNQYVIARHTDTEHEHIHIIANRIMHGGKLVSDSHDYRRQEAIMREIERDFGLRRVAPSAEAERKAPTKGEIERALRTGEPSIRQQLQMLCDAAAKDCRSFTEYVERLEAVGVEVIPTVQLGGAKLSGIQYRLDGVVMKGSDLGKAYAAAGLQKRGISYDKDRDFSTAERCRQRESYRAFGEPDREPETGAVPERGGPSHAAGALGPGDGGAGRRDPSDASRDRRPDGERQAAAIGVGEGLQGGGGGGESSGRESERSLAGFRAGFSREEFRGGDSRASYGGALDRILALAETSATKDPGDQGRQSGGGRGGGRASEARDRSLEAVQRQIAAMGVSRFEVGIRDAKTGKMMNREWTAAELERSVPWLKRMNARGCDIYIRPAGHEHGLVLVDDLKPQALERMKAEGFAPAATIETSPGNYQGWVKLSDKPLSADVRRAAARWLAMRYGADPNSADSRHYGRLAGFTNQKPQYANGGLQPYVLAHDCTGDVARAAPELLKLEQAMAMKEMVKVRQERRLEERREAVDAQGRFTVDPDPVEYYRRQWSRLMQRYGREADLSRIDWMIATDMAKSGFTAQDIARAIMHSPDIERKAGHVEDYARRTAEKAVQESNKQEAREEARVMQKRQAKRSRSQDLDMGL